MTDGFRKDTLALPPEKAAALKRGSGQPEPLVPPRLPAEASPGSALRWVLESVAEQGHLRRVPIHPLPFRVGRRPGLDLTLPSETVSKLHAEIYEDGGQLRLRDLGSTNGTFLNRGLITEAPLREGDVVHFADFEFRLGLQGAEALEGEPREGSSTVSLGTRDLPHQFLPGTRELTELLREEAVTVEFQPIVLLPGRVVAAYEVLGRGCHPSLPEAPNELFEIAATLGLEAKLSRLFRKKAIELVRSRSDLPTLFLNTHPAELRQPDLVESLGELRSMAPHLDLALEIHESALAAPEMIRELRRRLAEMNVGLAYDDFGAGQARLLELAEAPPHFLKFDIRFVSGIDHAPPTRRRLLASLVSMARDLLVKTVAEGIETAAELEVCVKIGFTHGQGFHLGHPLPVDKL